MSHENKKVTRLVHRLICEAFHGSPPTPTHQVRHLDGNRQNNLPSNMTWGTQEENWADREAHGRGMKGEKHPAAKFSNFERQALRWAIEKGLTSQRNAARALGITQSSISEIVHGSEGNASG
jgi:transcriptional regulator with GAF, ATPase, and Fis domain